MRKNYFKDKNICIKTKSKKNSLKNGSNINQIAQNKEKGIPISFNTKTNGSFRSSLDVTQAVFNERTKNSPSLLNHNNSNIQLKTDKMKSHYSGSPNYFCIYCNISFPSKAKLQAHCQTEEHQSLIISDGGRDWKYRPPPRGILSNEYSICQCVSDKDTSTCRFGSQCIQAHSKEELLEWKERFEYRSMKLEKAKEKELHGASYADKLLEKLSSSQNIELLVSEKIDGIIRTISSNTNLTISQKPSKHMWTLSLQCPYTIHVVSLLYDSHRNHFGISNITVVNSYKRLHKTYRLSNEQEWINSDVEQHKSGGPSIMEYLIEVNFYTEIYGTFRQALVVDFGIEPAFIQKFCVDIVPLGEFKELESARTTIITQTNRWCAENGDIVCFEHPLDSSDSFNDEILHTYPPPTNQNIVLSQSSLERHPTKNNYKSRMHDLLNYEEMAQFEHLSHFNIKSYLHLCPSYLIMPSSVSVANYALPGELYAKLDLSSEISEDSPSGRLILNNCNSILLAKSENDIKGKKLQAYEALIETKTKKELYLRLPKKMVSELNLKSDDEVAFDMQFQLNRLPFCEMHFAIDHTSPLNFLFPDILNEPVIPWSPSMQWKDLDDFKLNLKQKEAFVATTASVALKLPPIIIIGPFGTGKTFTIGQALHQLLQHSKTKILICTHSNSAADIYIKDYLHPLYASGTLQAKPLRIYYRKRRVATVHSIVLQYCCFDKDNGQTFCLPTKQQFMKHRIIVTTINTSINIAKLGIPKGFFTHIFIDEAAQVMECSTLIPLSLATSSTRIVLAGDYMQMSTEVFSTICKERNLHLSLLERLYNIYPSDYPCKIMLVENYRSHPAIVKFTSQFFYEGRLKSKGKIPSHPSYQPLTFFTALGEDVQEATSTAFYNNSEVLEVSERVSEICRTWPTSLWGPLDQEQIGVVSPYLDQVMRIRAELRKKKLYKVSVERVLNVQGKEFRVIIISTVRTRHTCVGNDQSLDYGFLSNEKLLITAITRAQSLVAVVGDPISLCSLGKCRKIWEEFLHECSVGGSLFGITWSNLKSQLDGIELKKIYGLNPLAQEFIPRLLFLSPVSHPMTIYPTAASLPLQFYNYPRPIANPQMLHNLQLSYPGNFTGVGLPNLPLPIQPVVNTAVNPFAGVPYQKLPGIYPNRPALPAFAPSSSLSLYPLANMNHSMNQNILIPQPQLGMNILPNPSLIRPPGIFPVSSNRTNTGISRPNVSEHTVNSVGLEFNGYSSPVSSAERSNLNTSSPQQHIRERSFPVNDQVSLRHGVMLNNPIMSPSPLKRQSSPPDNIIRFRNNVHFPKENIVNIEEEVRSIGSASTSSKNESSPIPEDELLNSDSFMGEKFVEEISKLLSDQSPVKTKSNSSLSEDSYIFEIQRNLTSGNDSNKQTHYRDGGNFFNARPSPMYASSKMDVSVRELLKTTDQQTYFPTSNGGNEKGLSNGLSKSDSLSNHSVNSLNVHSMSKVSSAPLQANPPLFSESSWNMSERHSSSQLSLASLLQSGSGLSKSGSSNVPLYLRKGSLNLSTNRISESRNELTGSLASSAGWDVNTILNGSDNSSDLSCIGNLSDFPLRSAQSDSRNACNVSGPSFINRASLDQSGLKTYAGVLRTSLGGSGTE